MRFLKTDTATIVTVGPFYDKTDGVTIETALTITNERISFTVDANNGSAPTLVLDNVTGATSGTSNDLNYITNCDAGLMQLELAAANVNYVGRAFLTITDAANHCPVFHEFMILPAVVFDAMVAGTDLFDVSMTQILGTAVSTPATAGILDINLKNIANAAVSTTSAQLGVNVVQLSGDGTAADNAEAFFDGTGYAGTNNVIPTVTTATNVTTVNGLAANVITAAAIANGAIDAATFAADVDAEILSYLVDDATRIDASALNTAAVTSIPAILADTGTDGVVVAAGSKTGYTLTATTGLGNQTANITGNLSGSVGSVTGNVGGSVASVAANGITATSIATDAINAAAVKADAVTKIQTGLATPTNITAGTITTVTSLTNPVTLADGAHGGSSASLALGAGATITKANGHALTLTGGTNGHGLLASGAGTGSGIAASGGSTSGSGIYAVGDADGMGIFAVGGDSALGLTAGLYLKSNSSGTPVGLYVEDGAIITDDAGTALLVSSTGGNGDGVTIVGNGSGGDLVADITGSVSGSVGSVTGDTKQTADVATLIATVGVAGAGLTALATQASVNTIDDFLDTEIAAILADTNELQTDWTNGGRLDLILDIIAADTTTDIPALIADVPTVAEFEARTLPSADYVVVGDTLAAVTTVTSVTSIASGGITATSIAADAIGASELAADAVTEIANAVAALVIDTGITLQDAMKLVLAVSAGKVSGAAGTTVTIRDTSDTYDRIVATVDASGNRSAITYVTT